MEKIDTHLNLSYSYSSKSNNEERSIDFFNVIYIDLNLVAF